DRVDRDDDRARKRKAIRIVGPPFNRIVDYCREAATLAQRWLDLQQTRPASEDDFRLRQAARFQDQLHQLDTAARPELRRLQAARWAALRGAARACGAALASVESLFDPRSELPSEDGCARRALRAYLLLVRDLEVDSQGEPRTEGSMEF